MAINQIRKPHRNQGRPSEPLIPALLSTSNAITRKRYHLRLVSFWLIQPGNGKKGIVG
jgi:hypothetical protein